jgi:hypothetical protein
VIRLFIEHQFKNASISSISKTFFLIMLLFHIPISLAQSTGFESARVSTFHSMGSNREIPNKNDFQGHFLPLSLLVLMINFRSIAIFPSLGLHLSLSFCAFGCLFIFSGFAASSYFQCFQSYKSCYILCTCLARDACNFSIACSC